MSSYFSSMFGRPAASVAPMPVNAAAAQRNANAAAAAQRNANAVKAQRNAAVKAQQTAREAAARNAAAARRAAYLAQPKEDRYGMCYDMKGRTGMNKGQAKVVCQMQVDAEEAEIAAAAAAAAASNPVVGAEGPLPPSGGNRKRKSTRKVQRKATRKAQNKRVRKTRRN
jgi:cytochrome c1